MMTVDKNKVSQHGLFSLKGRAVFLRWQNLCCQVSHTIDLVIYSYHLFAKKFLNPMLKNEKTFLLKTNKKHKRMMKNGIVCSQQVFYGFFCLRQFYRSF